VGEESYLNKVITCPHALGLAIPLVTAVSTSLSAKNGLLIRNRSAFENSRKITTVVFDKIGTLYNLIILDCAKVIIGDHVMMGPNVGIYTAGHPVHYEIRNQEYEYAFPISIGNNVWIGGNVVINPRIVSDWR